MPNDLQQLRGGDVDRFVEELRPGAVLETGAGHIERGDLLRAECLRRRDPRSWPHGAPARGGVLELPSEMIAWFEARFGPAGSQMSE